MAERVGRVVGGEPRRRMGFGAAGAALIAVLVLFIACVFTGAPSAKTDHRAQAHSRSALTPQQQGAANFVNGLLSKMTVAEKFGQLEMAGPSTPTGSDLIPLAKEGKIGSVLDLTGVNNINAVQKAALQSRLHIPLIFSLDVIHGYKTLYPISLGESSSWDPGGDRGEESRAAEEGDAEGSGRSIAAH